MTTLATVDKKAKICKV